MKNKKLTLTIIALMLGVTTVFAQGWRNANRPGANYVPGTCMNILLDLSEEQQVNIKELISAHQNEMVELRVKMRSTFDPVERNETRGEMLKKVQAHRSEVRNLLSDDQQKKYDLLQYRGFNRNQNFAARQRGLRGQGNFGGCRGGRGFRGNW